MNIGNLTDLNSKDAITRKTSTVISPSTQAPTTSVPSTGKDNVTTASLSPIASTLAALEPELRAPEFDQAKVDAIKQAMREGKFEVDASRVADKLIASVQDMFSRKNAS
jgi:negative regulator of flagellin synthesis FlgM